ncbi:MAG: Ppx/GppA phosphatase family protein [Burkholderiaceae bacterium]
MPHRPLAESMPAAELPGLLAAVDLGSNSFRLLIGRVDRTGLGEQIRPIDALKESVRLAAGLGRNGSLDAAARQRGLESLARFGERLRSFAPDAVRVVATNTLRVATNAHDFIESGEAALGFPISVISGREEARLIYLGAAHELALDGQDRLIIDIGGGSTECIIGRNYDSLVLESAGVGCVTLTSRFFGDGTIDRKRMRNARYAAREVFAPYARMYRKHGWTYAVGTSGTAKALIQFAMQSGATDLGIDHLENLAAMLAKAGHADLVRIEGLKPDRRPVIAGGVATMLAAFDEFGIDSMRYCPGALRQGALYDMLGRSAGDDMRRITVSRMADGYSVDIAHARNTAASALALFDAMSHSLPAEDRSNCASLIEWAAYLAEIGMSISHDSYHKHSAYIVHHADMPGFSRNEQDVLSRLVLGHTGGLRKMRSLLRDEQEWLMVLCLRIATILHRHRDEGATALPDVVREGTRVRIHWSESWRKTHPLTHESLKAEIGAWAATGSVIPFAATRAA